MSCQTQSAQIFPTNSRSHETFGPLAESDFEIACLPNSRQIPSPAYDPVTEHHRVPFITCYTNPDEFNPRLAFYMAGLREHYHFNPRDTVVGIATCGGICPGLNDVIRSLTYTALNMGCKKVIGFKKGYRGLSVKYRDDIIDLTPDFINRIHYLGGTVLGSSRGQISNDEILDTLQHHGVNVFFPIGGDGTQRASRELCDLIKQRGLDISIIGIPKTIDNDIPFISYTFGFDTAVEHARSAIQAAHTEAHSAPMGVGIVRLMGRNSGFIAAMATIATGDVNILLIPESPFEMDTLFEKVKDRLMKRDHCVIVVAEGAGIEHLQSAGVSQHRDASGNVKYGDIGHFLQDSLRAFLRREGLPTNIKYIDPSYMIRSTVPTSADAAFCVELAERAVESALCGKTACIVGRWNDHYTLVPLTCIARGSKVVNTNQHLWRTVRKMTVYCGEE